jgi:hypothetical protein
MEANSLLYFAWERIIHNSMSANIFVPLSSSSGKHIFLTEGVVV